MSGPRGGKTDWTDPEQIKAYHHEWYMAHRGEQNGKAKEARRNRPIGDGGKRRGRNTDGFFEAAYSTENRYAEEISWDINKEKLRRNREE